MFSSISATCRKGSSYLIVIVTLFTLGWMGSEVKSSEVSEHTMTLARANNEFAVHLYKTLKEANESGNLFFSPLSIATALGMTHLGARGTSSAQMSEVLRFSRLEDEHLHNSFKELNTLLFESDKKYTLRSANKLYGKNGGGLLQGFLDDTGKFYKSAFEGVNDFVDPEVRRGINDWVEKETEGKIRDLIPDGVLSSLTKLVLVNAIYFKANWAQAFHPEDTKPGVFNMADETTHLQMMQKKGEVNMTDDKTRKCFVLEMPYDDDDLSMLAVLPWDNNGLSDVEAQLDMDALDFWDRDIEPENARYWFPKFKLDDTFKLSSALRSMGMGDAFDASKADFSGITGDRSLFISEVVHKSFVDITEEGTEAAAATGVVMQARSLGRGYRLNFDHPFLFLIRDRRTKAILFMGRFANPPHDTRLQHEEL